MKMSPSKSPSYPNPSPNGRNSAGYVQAVSIQVPTFIPNPNPAKYERTYFCCFGAGIWTHFIAGTQIFLSLSLIAFAFVTKPKVAETVDVNLEGNSDFNELSSFNKVKVVYLLYAFDTRVLLFQGTFLLVRGAILFIGARLEKPSLLIVWCMATILCLGLYTFVLLVLLLLFIFGNGSYLLLIFLIVLLPFAAHFLCLSVVSTHRHEVVTLQKRLHPHPINVLHSVSYHENQDISKIKF